MAELAINEFVVWSSEAPLLSLCADHEFQSWAPEGGLLLDIDESDILTARRNVAIF